MLVEVLISTYNGEKYIERQINSIIGQNDVDIHVTVRDDGSQDSTVNVLTQLKDKYPNKISVFAETNVGYKKSFLNLLQLASKADYYSYSDQDDIWLPNKLISAVSQLSSVDSTIKLYSSNLNIVDSNLKLLYKTRFKKERTNIYSEIVRHRFAGCTFLFSEDLKNLVYSISEKYVDANLLPGHDCLMTFVAFTFGKVCLDENSYINHIRYEDSVTAGGNGLYKRFKVEYRHIFSRRNNRSELCRYLLSYESLPAANNEILNVFKQISGYKDSLLKRLHLLIDTRYKSGLFLADLGFKVKVILGIL